MRVILDVGRKAAALNISPYELARHYQMGCARLGAGHRAGTWQQRRADVRVDEPRGAAKNR